MAAWATRCRRRPCLRPTTRAISPIPPSPTPWIPRPLWMAERSSRGRRRDEVLGLGRGPSSVDEARRSHPARERRPQRERDRDHRQDEDCPGRACQQQPAADAKREPGRRNDARVGESVDLILGTSQHAAGAVRHGRELIEDRAAAVNDGIGELAHVGSIRNVVENVVGIGLGRLVLGHRTLLGGWSSDLSCRALTKISAIRGVRTNGLRVTVPAALKGTPRTPAWRHVVATCRPTAFLTSTTYAALIHEAEVVAVQSRRPIVVVLARASGDLPDQRTAVPS